MSTNATAAAAAAAGSPAASQSQQDKKKPEQQQDGTVTKTVQTVEVRSSAGQPDEEGVLKPVKVVHEIPAKDSPGAKQD